MKCRLDDVPCEQLVSAANAIGVRIKSSFFMKYHLISSDPNRFVSLKTTERR